MEGDVNSFVPTIERQPHRPLAALPFERAKKRPHASKKAQVRPSEPHPIFH